MFIIITLNVALSASLLPIRAGSMSGGGLAIAACVLVIAACVLVFWVVDGG